MLVAPLPQGTHVVAPRRYRLTPETQSDIVAFIRAGGYPQVAAQAAGIPAHVFDRWMALGNPVGRPPRWKPHPLYTPLWDAVRQAVAQARLSAEVAAHKDEALRWLMQGPGKDRPDAVGWTYPVRLRPAEPGGQSGGLDDPELRALLAALLDALEPFPEAREAAARAISEFGIRPRRGGRKPERVEPPPGGGELPGLSPDAEVRPPDSQRAVGDVPGSALAPSAPTPPADPDGEGSPKEAPPGPQEHGPGDDP